MPSTSDTAEAERREECERRIDMSRRASRGAGGQQAARVAPSKRNSDARWRAQWPRAGGRDTRRCAVRRGWHTHDTD